MNMVRHTATLLLATVFVIFPLGASESDDKYSSADEDTFVWYDYHQGFESIKKPHSLIELSPGQLATAYYKVRLPVHRKSKKKKLIEACGGACAFNGFLTKELYKKYCRKFNIVAICAANWLGSDERAHAIISGTSRTNAVRKEIAELNLFPEVLVPTILEYANSDIFDHYETMNEAVHASLNLFQEKEDAAQKQKKLETQQTSPARKRKRIYSPSSRTIVKPLPTDVLVPDLRQRPRIRSHSV